MSFDYVKVRLISSNVALRLQYMADCGIVIKDVSQVDELTVLFTLRRNEFRAIQELFLKKGDMLTRIHFWGPGVEIERIGQRPILAVSILLLLLLTLWIPGRVLFVQVAGNSRVSSQHIMQCAEASGIRFGQKVESVRSEKAKNSLLQAIPQLSWVGINTSGCVATISVSERQVSEQREEESGSVSSLVSSRDAQITSITVTAGTPLCKPGDTVSKGQVLISGFTDCGIKIQATQASGDVYGNTAYEKKLIFPNTYQRKGEVFKKYRNIFLQIGKKEIKIWKGSGISGIICDKMYKNHYLTLPGGFILPMGLKIETCVYYRACEEMIPMQQAQPIMKQLSKGYLLEAIISGEILSLEEQTSEIDGAYCLAGSYRCQEMIGRIYNEKIGAYHEQNYRKDRKR